MDYFFQMNYFSPTIMLIIFSLYMYLSELSGKISTKGMAKRESRPGASQTLQIESSVFEHNGMIPSKYTCDGENISPPLQIVNVPEQTISLALVMHDPDAKVAGGWTHWTIWNIAPDVNEIKENSVPSGATEGMTNFGKPGYGGPCPPRVEMRKRVEARPTDSVHHYHFILFALDSIVTLNEKATKEDFEHFAEKHIIDKAVMIGLYERNV